MEQAFDHDYFVITESDVITTICNCFHELGVYVKPHHIQNESIDNMARYVNWLIQQALKNNKLNIIESLNFVGLV